MADREEGGNETVIHTNRAVQDGSRFAVMSVAANGPRERNLLSKNIDLLRNVNNFR